MSFRGDSLQELKTLTGIGNLLDFFPDTQFWVKDNESRFLACNKAFAAHFGLSGIHDLEGRSDLEFSPQHLAREYIQDDRLVISTGKVLADKMELVRDKDDSLNWYATTKSPIRDIKGSVIGTAGFTRKINCVQEGSKQIRGMDQAINAIITRYGENLTIPGLADLADMSVDNFERKFKSLLRETPLKYLNRIRMRASCSLLLHTDLSIGEISRQAGFSDQSYFAKRFFAHLRIRPIDYRRKYSKLNQTT